MTRKLFKDIDVDVSSNNLFNIVDEKGVSLEFNVNDEKEFGMDQIEYSINNEGTYFIKYDSFNCNIKIVVNCDATIIDLSSQVIDCVSCICIDVSQGYNLSYLGFDGYNKSYSKKFANVFKNAYVDFKIVGLNKEKSENYVKIDLLEDGAKSDFKLVTVATDNCDNVYDVTMNNLAKNTSGDIWQKAVCKDGGKNVFLATGHIKKGSDDASNYQESRVLLLDGACSGDASPLLLIDHYNVVAGHAASVLRVNQEELYYLQTRGIDQKNAEYLMTFAFIKPLFDEIKDEELRQNLLDKVSEIL